MILPSPGKWIYDDDKREVVDDKGQVLARLFGSDVSLGEDFANGSLMAASKDLLEACRAIIYLESYRGTRPDLVQRRYGEAIEVIRAAIARARGKS